MFDKIKVYYDTGLWSLQRVWNVVGMAITKEEYQQITGFVYPAKLQQTYNVQQQLTNVLSRKKVNLLSKILFGD